MSRAEEFWRERKIHNSWGLMVVAAQEIPGLVPVYLAWSHNDGSRISMTVNNGYSAISPRFKTDPDGHWTTNGTKQFSTYFQGGTSAAEKRHAALREAQDWCNVKYGIAEWGTIPGFPRDWFPIEVVEWAKKKVREGR
jgi:hypothetical protein